MKRKGKEEEEEEEREEKRSTKEQKKKRKSCEKAKGKEQWGELRAAGESCGREAQSDIKKSRNPTHRIPAYSRRQERHYTSFSSRLIASILASSAASVASNASTDASGSFTPK